MANPTVLITGCSDGSLDSALALRFHETGHRVFATARNFSKLAHVRAAGIETLILDVLSDGSIAQCVAEVRQLTGESLDILVNNARAGHFGSLADSPPADGRMLFDLNVWSNLATTQAFLPLLLKSTSGGLIVNHTSAASVLCPPFQAFYGASEVALAMLTVSLRAELSPFGVTVVELKSGSVASNISEKQQNVSAAVSTTSLYYAARDWLDTLRRGQTLAKDVVPADVWACMSGRLGSRPGCLLASLKHLYVMWSAWIWSTRTYGSMEGKRRSPMLTASSESKEDGKLRLGRGVSGPWDAAQWESRDSSTFGFRPCENT